MGDWLTPEFLAEFKEFAARHYMMCGMWLMCLGALIYVQGRIIIAHVVKVSTAAATQKVNHEDGIFVDVRPAQAFGKEHIAGAENLTLAEIRQGRVQRLDPHREHPLIVVARDKMDTDGFNSARLLKKLGFRQVFALEGGLEQWKMENLPVAEK